jgi:hypothetical protein
MSYIGSASSINFPIQLGFQLGPIRATWLIEPLIWALFLNFNKGVTFASKMQHG